MNDVDKQTALALLSNYAVEHDSLVCIQTNLNGQIQRNFKKSTGDKTKLQKPDYMLGGPSQKEMIIKEKAEVKEMKKLKRLQEQSDKRPNKDKATDKMKATSFTVDKMEKGRTSFFSGFM